MRKVISILLVLVMLLSACSNVFAEGSLTPEEVTENCLAYFDENEGTIMEALMAAAGPYAEYIESLDLDLREAIEGYLATNAAPLCTYIEELCASPTDKDAKITSVANQLTEALISILNLIMPGFNLGNMLADNIRSFANSYAEVIVEEYKEQLNLATIVSDNPMFFFAFSLAEFIAIIGLIVALAKKKTAR